jgi:esterase
VPDVQLPGIRLYFEESGSGVPILCIHGMSSSAMAWKGSTAELEQVGRVIVYDRRGCTRSERPEPYNVTNVSEHADDAAALLEALSASPAIIIGRSYGGAIAIDLALRYPEHVRALALLEPGDVNLTPDMQAWAHRLTERLQTAAHEGVDTVAEVLLRDVLGDSGWEQLPDQLQQMFTNNSPAILAEVNGGVLDADAGDLAGINVPVLLVAASDSPEMFRKEVDAIAAAIPHSRKVLISGGHLVNPSDPAVLEFIQDVVSGGEMIHAAN